jgi:hypothetical protein
VTDAPLDPTQESIPKQIRSLVLNQTVGQWVRALDLVLSQYDPTGLPVAMEAERVTKLAVFVMLHRWFDQDTICLLSDSSNMRIPKKLSDSSSGEIAALIDRPTSGMGEIENYEPEDPDAPPGKDGFSATIRPLEGGKAP